MTALIGIIGVVFSSYVVMPEWYDERPYGYRAEHPTMTACKTAIEHNDDICAYTKGFGTDTFGSVGQYTLESNTETKENLGKLNWVECTYWAGCYTVERRIK